MIRISVLTTFAMLIGGCSKTPEVPTGTDDSDTVTGSTGDSDTAAHTGDTAGDKDAVIGFPLAPYDCSEPLPQPPFDRRILNGTDSEEDIALDLDGFLITADFSNMLRYTYNGASQVFLAGVSDPAGIGVTPDGDIITADRWQNRVIKWDRDTGTSEVLATNVNSPNSIEVAPDGSFYVTDPSLARVYWINPATGDGVVVAEGLEGADGISFNPEYNLLYVGSVQSGNIYTIEVLGSGQHGQIEQLVEGANQPWAVIDGLQVDRCGNLYLADMFEVYRFDPVNRETIRVVEAWNWNRMPALRFGSGVPLSAAGPGAEVQWDPYKLYVSTYVEVLEIDIGVPNKPRWPAVWP